MRFLVIILVLLDLKISAQESNMRWLTSCDHYLGVFFVGNESEKDVWVRDTFAFINTSDKEMVIQKAHVKNPEFFKFTKTIKPGDTGYIYYAERINPYSAAMDTVEYRAVFSTNFSPWSMITIHYFVVRGGTKCMKNKAGKTEKVVYQHPYAYDYLELNLHSNGKPKSYGWKSKENNNEILIWYYYNLQGMPIGDSVFSKKIQFVVNQSTQPYPVKCQVQARVNGKWVEPFYRYADYCHTAFITQGTDSLKVFNDSGQCFQLVNYRSFTSGTAFGLNLIKTGDLYFYQSKIQIPITFDPDVFGIVWKADNPYKPVFPPVEKRMEELRQKYPEVDFNDLYGSNGYYLGVYRTSQSELDFRNSLENISQEPYIDCLSQVVYVNQNQKAAYFQNTSVVKLPMYVKNEEIDRLLNQFGFERTSQESYNAAYYAKYKSKIIDESSLRDFNGLSTSSACENVSHWIMMMAEVGIDEMQKN